MNLLPAGRLAPTLVGTVCAALVTLASMSADSAGAAEAPRLVLDGFCPTSIVGDKRWAQGDPAITLVHDGREYRFASDEHRERFLANPETFAPALAGDCIATWARKGDRVPGQIQFGAFFGGRLFLFADADRREEFRAATGVLGTADLAYDGRCPVALAEGRSVRGEAEFFVHHAGLRYRFAGEQARTAFLAAPEGFAVEQKRDEFVAADKLVEATGKSACAFCDYKVWPMLTKDELGLAIEATDGTIYVVEHADTKFPVLYKKRFENLPLKVMGREIRREGKTVWLVPDSLTEAT